MSMLFDVDEVPVASGKSNEWYTPARYIEAARAVMQGIDLDPASCELANRTVKAAKYYTKEDNGLAQEWKASGVWLNPPYSSTAGTLGRSGNQQGLVKPFIAKLLREYRQDNIKQAVLCVTTDTDARWFPDLWEHSICFADHKVMFHRPGNSDSGQFFGTCFVYLGPNITSFVEHFTEFGPVITPDGVHRRPQPLPQPTLWDKEITP